MFGFNIPGMGQFQQNMPNQQQMSANNVRATNGSSPSMGQMQQGMGGLMTNETQQGGFSDFMGGLMSSFAPAFNSMVGSGYQALGMEPPQQEFIPVPKQEEPTQEVQPPKDLTSGWGGVKNDNDAIRWALQNGDITAEEARWLMKWQQGDANGNTNFVDGGRGTRNWDYWKSDLSDRNKRIVDKFYKSVSGNWGDAPAGAQQKQKPGGFKGLLHLDGGVVDGIEKAKGNIKAIRGLLG